MPLQSQFVALMIVGWLPLHIVTWTSDVKGLNVNGLEGLDCLIRMYLVVGLSLPPPDLAIQMIQRCFTSQMASHLDMSSIIQTAPINSPPVLPLVSPTKPTDTTQASPEHETQIQITVELPRAPSPAVFVRSSPDLLVGQFLAAPTARIEQVAIALRRRLQLLNPLHGAWN
ncbi:hypothetical protein BC936DRAFT_148233 [Jimgerdemannia flammicorona]|uniref:Uncharacterized protein n=1 Tax=Jimgerdemannia flammicorona TaxID=994334 RepID=A0A433D3G4_9FUNG|nr:hypothetical protein BC936DRAFT_148233 [Jimgerdemannia flammicorona]